MLGSVCVFEMLPDAPFDSWIDTVQLSVPLPCVQLVAFALVMAGLAG